MLQIELEKSDVRIFLCLEKPIENEVCTQRINVQLGDDHPVFGGREAIVLLHNHLCPVEERECPPDHGFQDTILLLLVEIECRMHELPESRTRAYKA